MAGLGTQPAGTSPVGFGTVTEAPELAPLPTAARFLDPVTRDWKLTTDGAFQQMPALRQRVLISLLTTRGTATAIPSFGIRLPRKMGDSFENEVANSVREVLRPMTDVERSIRVDQVIVERGAGGRARVTVSYTDTTTGATDQAVIS